DPRSAARAGPASAAMDGASAVAGKATSSRGFRGGFQVRPHGASRRFEESLQVLVGDFAGRRPGVDAALPQRLAAIDVADARGDALVEEELADWFAARL